MRELFLLTRCCLALLALLAGFALSARLLVAVLIPSICAFAWLRGWRSLVALVVSVAVLALPLLLVHGVINPTFPLTEHLGVVAWRATGGAYAAELAQRFALLFAAVAVWRGVPGLSVIALVAKARLPASIALTLVYAMVLVEVLKRRIAHIQLAMRSRGVLDGDNVRGRLHALVAMTVPLIATTLLEAVSRSEARARLGPTDLNRLGPVAGLKRPTGIDFALASLLVGSSFLLASYGW